LCVPCRRCTSSVGVIPTRPLSLRPEALGAGQEATNGLKHFKKTPLLGGKHSVRAVTLVNIVQASKMPCGSPLATITRKAAAVGEASEIRIRPFRRGSGDSTHARELVRNKGSLRWT
jgi:hypothetical protein